MPTRFHLLTMVLAVAACDRVTSPSYRDAGPDSAASLWEQVAAGVVNYNAVAGSSPDNVFIVGDLGTILHWNGVTLAPEASGTYANLRAVAVVNEDLAYAAGEQGIVLRRQGGYWVPELQVTTAILNAIVATPDVVIAAGEQGTILTYAQAEWKAVPNSRTDNYYAISNAADGVQVVGAVGVVARLAADLRSIATATAIPGYTKVLAGACPYSSGSLFVGVDGGFFYWVNGAATRLTGLPEKFLRAVSVANGSAWIVGHEGIVATGSPNGGPFTLVPIPDDRWALGVYAASSSDLWVVGRSGMVLRGPPGVRGVIDGGQP
jgi:hypothetical protein